MRGWRALEGGVSRLQLVQLCLRLLQAEHGMVKMGRKVWMVGELMLQSTLTSIPLHHIVSFIRVTFNGICVFLTFI